MKKIIKSLSVLGVCTLLSTSSFASDETSSAGKFFIGGSAGLSTPLKSSFTHKETKAKFGVSHSPLFSGEVGYHITDDISVSISTDFKVKYGIKFVLPKDAGGESVKSKADNQSFMINFNYDMADIGGFTPFFSVGAGIARFKVKQFNVPFNGLNELYAAGAGVPVAAFVVARGDFGAASKFATKKHTANCFAWQVGLGVSKPITESLKLNLAAKAQIVHGVSVKYKQFDQDATTKNLLTTGKAIAVYKEDKLKQLFGTGEITLGFTYDLPF